MRCGGVTGRRIPGRQLLRAAKRGDGRRGRIGGRFAEGHAGKRLEAGQGGVSYSGKGSAGQSGKSALAERNGCRRFSGTSDPSGDIPSRNRRRAILSNSESSVLAYPARLGKSGGIVPNGRASLAPDFRIRGGISDGTSRSGTGTSRRTGSRLRRRAVKSPSNLDRTGFPADRFDSCDHSEPAAGSDRVPGDGATISSAERIHSGSSDEAGLDPAGFPCRIRWNNWGLKVPDRLGAGMPGGRHEGFAVEPRRYSFRSDPCRPWNRPIHWAANPEIRKPGPRRKRPWSASVPADHSGRLQPPESARANAW